MNKQFLLILLAVVAILSGIFFLTKADEGGQQTQANLSSHVYGKADSSVTVLEYGDFECSACEQYFPIIQEIKKNYKDKIAFQFRHFPIVNSHPNAVLAARAAEAAGKQGKFWEMHDQLFAQQRAWAGSPNANKIFEDYATQLGLNVAQFTQDSASSEALDVINADQKEGRNQGVGGTPTFFINGQKIETPPSYDAFAKLIDEALAKANSPDSNQSN